MQRHASSYRDVFRLVNYSVILDHVDRAVLKNLRVILVLYKHVIETRCIQLKTNVRKTEGRARQRTILPV